MNMIVPVKVWVDLDPGIGDRQVQIPGRLINKIGQRNRRLFGLLRR